MWFLFIFFLQTVRWIPLMLNSSTKNYDASIIHDLLRGTKQIWRFPFKNFKSELRFKRQSQGLERHYFMIFVSLVSVKRCLKWKFFSRQKTYKNTEFKDACASFFYLFCKICLDVVNFPAKRLRKIRCSKYACADFLKKYNLHCQ